MCSHTAEHPANVHKVHANVQGGERDNSMERTSPFLMQAPPYLFVQPFCAGTVGHQCLCSRELSPLFCMKDILQSRCVNGRVDVNSFFTKADNYVFSFTIGV